MTLRSIAVVAALTIHVVAAAGTDDYSPTKKNNNNDEGTVCGLYLAPSFCSTDEFPQLGIFAGIDYNAGVTIGFPDIAVPVFDIHHHSSTAASTTGDEKDNNKDEDEALPTFWQSQMWNGEEMGAQFEAQQTLLLIGGFGSLTNKHPSMTNVDWDHKSKLFRRQPPLSSTTTSSSLNSFTSGNISPYFNVTLKSTKIIPAGMELLDPYSPIFGEANDDDYTQSDYEKAQEALEGIANLYEKHKLSTAKRIEVHNFLLKHVLGGEGGGGNDNEEEEEETEQARIRQLLPKHPGKIPFIQERGGIFYSRNRNLIKSVDWLLKEGMCMDNIQPGPSTIIGDGGQQQQQQQQSGAFATRPLKQNQFIAPVPLLHIADNTALKGQLVENYCFGHFNSRVWLYPVGANINLINHSSENSNARLIWSKRSKRQNVFPSQMEWWKMSPSELEQQDSGIGLMMELIATRDIQEGEEIFIDYGKEWAEAWDSYTKSKSQQQQQQQGQTENSSSSSSTVLRALELNSQDPPLAIATESETPNYPVEDVMTGCLVKLPDDPEIFEATREWIEEEDLYRGYNIIPCVVTERRRRQQHQQEKAGGVGDESYIYTARVTPEDREDFLLENIPSNGILFVDKAYRHEMHNKDQHAFRHHIGLPDNLFPKAWMD